MNPTLAALYGLDKTASDNEQEEIDLSQISAADFLKGVEDGTIVLPEDEQEKQASDGELDLSEISAADFLKGIEDGSIVLPDDESEKTAGSIEDLTPEQLANMSGEELLQLAASLDEDGPEKTAADKAELEKMAESGELAHWDMVGRLVAHATRHEIEKMASEDGEMPDVIDPADISAADMTALLESGEYELVETE